MIRESKLQSDMLSGLNSQKKVRLYKLPDNTRGVRKPFDFLGVMLGLPVAIEAKLTTVETSGVLPAETVVCAVADLQAHQENSLLEFQEDEGFSYIAAGIYSNTSTKLRRTWLIPLSTFKYKSRARKESWTVKELTEITRNVLGGVVELVWKPTIGWTLPESML